MNRAQLIRRHQLSSPLLGRAHAPFFPLLSPENPGERTGTRSTRTETASRLFAVVVHIGRGPNHGHYVAVVKSGGRWLLFDDEIVELVDEQVRVRARVRVCCCASSRHFVSLGYFVFFGRVPRVRLGGNGVLGRRRVTLLIDSIIA